MKGKIEISSWHVFNFGRGYAFGSTHFLSFDTCRHTTNEHRLFWKCWTLKGQFYAGRWMDGWMELNLSSPFLAVMSCVSCFYLMFNVIVSLNLRAIFPPDVLRLLHQKTIQFTYLSAYAVYLFSLYCSLWRSMFICTDYFECGVWMIFDFYIKHYSSLYTSAVIISNW